MHDNLDEGGAPRPSQLPDQAAAARVLPVLEERLTIARELIETGRVRLTRHVHETTEAVNVPLQHDEVHVERVPLNLTLPAGALAPATRYEGDVLIIPVLREVAVVETRLLLVEELRITRQQHTTQHTETVQLRHEELTAEHLPPAPSVDTTS
ncbi:MAG: YsnF/AvaK domain-containing protein [Janthinobacterium lividum]